MKAKRVSLGLFAMIGIVAASSTTLAAPIDDAGFFDTIPETLLTWELDGGGAANPVLSNITLPFDEYQGSGLMIDPVLPGIRLTNDNSINFHIFQAIGGSNPYGLSAQPTGSLLFDPPIRSFGFFFLDIEDRNATFTARDVNDDAIESVVFGGSFVDGSGALGFNTIDYGFIGITSATPIYRVEIAAISGLIDNLRFSPVPEPASLGCLLLGASVFAVRRRGRSMLA